jgi:hypothetical protein
VEVFVLCIRALDGLLAIAPGGKRKKMTDNEIDEAVRQIAVRRQINNVYFCEWLAASFKCVCCRPYAWRYQALIRQNDIEISEANKPLCE